MRIEVMTVDRRKIRRRDKAVEKVLLQTFSSLRGKGKTLEYVVYQAIRNLGYEPDVKRFKVKYIDESELLGRDAYYVVAREGDEPLLRFYLYDVRLKSSPLFYLLPKFVRVY